MQRAQEVVSLDVKLYERGYEEEKNSADDERDIEVCMKSKNDSRKTKEIMSTVKTVLGVILQDTYKLNNVEKSQMYTVSAYPLSAVFCC